jgi:hypothetical protein
MTFHSQLASMSAEYIEVIHHTSRVRCKSIVTDYYLHRRDYHRCRYWTSSPSYRKKSNAFLPHTSYPTTACPCKLVSPRIWPILACVV